MTIARKLHCTNPDCPHETLKTMSDWIREELPDSNTGFTVSDLDFIIWNYKTKRTIILEVKTNNADCKYWQRSMWKNINRWIRNGIDQGWEYLGFHLLIFSGKDFSQPVYYDYNPITEQELKDILSLKETT